MNGQGHTPAPTVEGRLDSWKEIAAYLKREVRTVQRWEKSAGLPVHRLLIERQSTVYAYKAELDAWYRDRRPEAEFNSGSNKILRLFRIHPIPLWVTAAAVVLVGAVFVVAYLSRKKSIPAASISQIPTLASAESRSFNFTAINFPSATRTRATALNDQADIVGDYFDSAGVRHAYLLKQGHFKTIDAPGAIETRGIAINNLGVIGGTFLDDLAVRHSFLLEDGVFTVLDFPGATATFLQDLNDQGEIVGAYNDTAGNQHGFLKSAGKLTTIDFPGAVQGTVAGGINASGQIIGNYGDASGSHGFLLSKGKLSPIEFPGAFSRTVPSGINARGEIVGFYDDANGTIHGFSLIAGSFRTVDVPSSFSTYAYRINGWGQIVGQYLSSGQHSFLATLSLTGTLPPNISYHHPVNAR
jgi:hypothetical protein